MKIEVKFITEIPNEIDAISYEEVLEWLTFNLKSGSLSDDNPLSDTEMEVKIFSIDYTVKNAPMAKT